MELLLEIVSSPEAFTTLVVGVVGFWWHSASSKKFMKRQHTFNVVSNSLMDKVLQDRMAEVRRYFPDYTGDDVLCPKDWEVTSQDNDLRGTLNFLEGISAAVRYRDLDENLLKKTYRGIIEKMYETFEEHIHSHRQNKKSQKAFEHLEWLYERWCKK